MALLHSTYYVVLLLCMRESEQERFFPWRIYTRDYHHIGVRVLRICTKYCYLKTKICFFKEILEYLGDSGGSRFEDENKRKGRGNYDNFENLKDNENITKSMKGYFSKITISTISNSKKKILKRLAIFRLRKILCVSEV